MKLLLVILVLLLFPVFAYAQTEQPVWPPDPGQIFAPGITVTVTGNNPSVNWSNDASPMINNIYHTLGIYDYATSKWRTFSFPESIFALGLVREYSDGILILEVATRDTDPFTPRQYLRFDPVTGGFTPTSDGLECGLILPQNAKSPWVFYADPQTRRASVCNAQTGEMIALVPRNQTGVWAEASPDGEWVVWVAQGNETFMLEMYATDLKTHLQNQLGSLSPRDYLRLDRWIDQHRGMLYYAYMPEGGEKDLVSFDVTQPQSLKTVFTGRANFYDADTPQYRYLQVRYLVNRYADVLDHMDCGLSIYYPLQDQEVSDKLAYDCGAILERSSNEYFYLGYNDDGSSSLYDLDVKTGNRTEYLRGEIEGLENLSPNGRYATLVTDHSGKVDMAGQDPFWVDLSRFVNDPDAKLQVFDLETKQIVYEQPITSYPDTQWTESSKLVIFPAEPGIQPTEAVTLRVVTFTEQGGVARQIANVAGVWVDAQGSIIPEGHDLLIWTDQTSGTKGISILDLDTDEITPLIINMNSPDYEILFGDWSGKNIEVEVTVPDPKLRVYEKPHIQYTLHLP